MTVTYEWLDSGLVTVCRMAVTMAEIEPVDLNVNWSLNPDDGGGVVSSAA